MRAPAEDTAAIYYAGSAFTTLLLFCPQALDLSGIVLANKGEESFRVFRARWNGKVYSELELVLLGDVLTVRFCFEA